MADYGVKISKGTPVERHSGEGHLDQNLGVSVDERMEKPVFLDSVRDEDDIFERCPVLDRVDLDQKLGGTTLRALLESHPYLLEGLMLNPAGESFQDYKSASGDRYAVSDAKWIKNPSELLWKSALLAQLNAKLNAIKNFLGDPSSVDFSGSLSDDERRIVASRARELADKLRDDAFTAINAPIDSAVERMKESTAKTREHFLRYTVTTEDARQEGGLTEAELDSIL